MKINFSNNEIVVDLDVNDPKDAVEIKRREFKGKGKRASNMTKSQLEELVKVFAKALDIDIT